MQGIHRRAGLPSQPTAAASDRETMRTGRQPIILAALTPIGLTWRAPPALHYGQAARREVLPVLIGEPPPASAVSPLLRQQPPFAGYTAQRTAPAAARAPIILSASSIREPREMPVHGRPIHAESARHGAGILAAVEGMGPRSRAAPASGLV